MKPCVYEFQKDQQSFRVVEEPMSLADSKKFCEKFNETLANISNNRCLKTALGYLNNCLKTVDEDKIAYRKLKLYRVGFAAKDENKSLVGEQDQHLYKDFSGNDNNFVIGQSLHQVTPLNIDDSEKWPFLCSKANPMMAEVLKLINRSILKFSESSYEVFNSHTFLIYCLVGFFFLIVIIAFVVWYCKKRSFKQSKVFVQKTLPYSSI